MSPTAARSLAKRQPSGKVRGRGCGLAIVQIVNEDFVYIAHKEMALADIHALGGREVAVGRNEGRSFPLFIIQNIAFALGIEGVQLLGAEVGDEHTAVVGIGAFTKADSILNHRGCLRLGLLFLCTTGQQKKREAHAGHANHFFHESLKVFVYLINLEQI